MEWRLKRKGRKDGSKASTKLQVGRKGVLMVEGKKERGSGPRSQQPGCKKNLAPAPPALLLLGAGWLAGCCRGSSRIKAGLCRFSGFSRPLPSSRPPLDPPVAGGPSAFQGARMLGMSANTNQPRWKGHVLQAFEVTFATRFAVRVPTLTKSNSCGCKY